MGHILGLVVDHITGHGDEKMRLQALRAGAVEFLSKPFDDEILLESVRAAINN